jgi:trehalose synthase
MQQIQVQPAPLGRLETILSPTQSDQLATTASHARALLADRVVWNVNATAHGGGVAEMLQGLLAYARGAGVDARWLVLDGDAEFFAITKRSHNALHDPQTAGMAEGFHRAGVHVIWHCHIGRDDSTADTDSGWEFLRGYLTNVDAFVFSRSGYVPDWVAPTRVRVIAPSIDPFSTKNRHLDDELLGRVLRRAGLIAGRAEVETVGFTRRDGTVGVVREHRSLLPGSEPPPADAPLVVQVSRWDRLKDMAGVLAAFADHVAPTAPRSHPMLVGPDVSGVSDDPEGGRVSALCLATPKSGVHFCVGRVGLTSARSLGG